MCGHEGPFSEAIPKDREKSRQCHGTFRKKLRNLISTYLESSSLGRVLKIMERVPIGDLRNNSTSPRRDVFKLMTGMEELRKCHAILSRKTFTQPRYLPA